LNYFQPLSKGFYPAFSFFDFFHLKAKNNMPNVVKEDIDQLNAVLKVQINREDYEGKFNSELKKISKTASLKGFRKGKTPLSFLKKMYGKGLLNDIVMEMLQKELSEAINDEKTNYVGRPLPTADFKPVDFDANDLKDYEFTFDVGMAPDFTVKGINGEHTFDFQKAVVPTEKVDEQIELILKRKGEQVEVEDTIQDNDLVAFNASELDGDAVKEDGWKTTFSILASRIKDGDTKTELLKKKKGDTIRFNIFELEEGADDKYVKKYLLNFTDTDIEEGTTTGEMYEATIEKVTRLVPAKELTQEILDEFFGEGEVSNEEEARAIISKNIGAQDEFSSNTLLFRDIREKFIELNREEMPLPKDFLKRWVEASYESQAPSILENFDDFQDDLRWTLIKNKLYKEFDIELKQEDIQAAATNRVMGYFGGQYQPGMDEMVKNIVERMLQDSEQVNSLASDVLSQKLFLKLKEKVSLNEVSISAEDLQQKMADLQAEESARNAQLSAAGNDDEEE
jgi:trigger factor